MVIKFVAAGFYIPSFFLLNVMTDEDISNFEKASKESKSIFIHEYIHFLQDIFTLYGLWNINYTVNQVYAVNQEGLQGDTIVFPIEINNEEINTLTDLNKIYFGTDSLNDDILTVESVRILPNDYIKGYEQIELVELDSTSLGGNITFRFGALAILESMAYIIEKRHFGDYSTPTFPYKIVDIIIDKSYSDLNLDPQCRIAVCEQALNSIHPGLAFIRILDKLQEMEIKLDKPNDIHLLCERGFFLEDERGIKMSIPFAIKAETRKSRENLKTYFPDKDLVKVNDWIDYVFDFADKFQEEFHFSKVYEDYDYLVKVINDLGTPLISTNRKYYFKNPEIDQAECHIAMLPAISELVEFALAGKTNCDLKPHCLDSIKDLVDDLCDNEPWKKKDQEPKCYMAALLFLWSKPISDNS